MKKILLIAICFLSLQLSSFHSLAQFPISGTLWDGFVGTSPTGASTFPTVPATIDPGATAVSISQWNRQTVLWNTSSDSYNSKDFTLGGSLATAQADNKYLYFTITNDALTELEVTAISIPIQASNHGPQTVQLEYSIAGGADQDFGAPFSTGVDASSGGGAVSSTAPFTGTIHLCAGQTATFKLYGWGGDDMNGTLRINNGASITADYADGVLADPFNSTDISFPACEGSEVDLYGFDASGVWPFTYAWAGPGGYTSTDDFPFFTATSTSTGTYSLTLTDAWGCSSTVGTDVYTMPGPDATITLSGPLAICSPGSLTLSVPFNASYNYVWRDISTGIVLVGFSNAYNTGTSGVFYATVDNGSCVVNSDTVTVTVTTTPSPTVTVLGLTTICTPNVTTLSTPSVPGYTYQWNDGVTAIPGATDNTYGAATTGNYNVTINNGTCSATSTNHFITVNTSPAAIAVTPTGPITVCAGTAALLSSTTTPTGVTYRWWRSGPPAATAIPGATNSTYNVATLGTATYSLVVTNGSGCTATSNGVMVTVNATPLTVITPGPTAAICSGTPVTLSTTSPGVNTYQWLSSNVPITGATNANYSATVAGTYRVVVTRASTGCFDTTATPTVVTVQASPAAASAVISPAGVIVICSTDSAVLTTPNTPGLSYQWYNPAAITGATNYRYAARTSGTYTVRVDNGGCSTTSAAAVIVNVNTAPLPAVTVAGSTVFCAGSSVSITADFLPGYTYQWYNGTLPVAGATNDVYTATTSGVYTARVTSTNGCAIVSNATTVTAIPTPSIVLTAHTFCTGNNLLMAASTAGISGVSYQWQRNGVNIAGAVSANYVATQGGTYKVYISIPGACAGYTNPEVITESAAFTPVITFNGTYFSTATTYATYQWTVNSVSIPGATTYRVTPHTNGSYRVLVTDAGGCTLLSPERQIFNVGVNDVNIASSISIYPNPTTGMVHVAAATEVKVTIATIEGKLIMSGTSKNDMDVSSLANGLYMIMAYDDEGNKIHVEKLIKQ